MANKYSGAIVTLGLGDGASSYDTIAQIVDIEGLGITNDDIDVTSRDSNRFREFIAGLAEADEVGFGIIWDPAETTHNVTAGLLSLAESGAVKAWQVKAEAGGTAILEWNFDSFVKSFSGSAPLNDKLMADVALKVTGKPTIS